MMSEERDELEDEMSYIIEVGSLIVHVRDCRGKGVSKTIAIAPGRVEVFELLYDLGYQNHSGSFTCEVARFNDTTYVVSQTMDMSHDGCGETYKEDVWLTDTVPDDVEALLEGVTEEQFDYQLYERLGGHTAKPGWAMSEAGQVLVQIHHEYLDTDDQPRGSLRTLSAGDVRADAQRLFERAAEQVASKGSNVVTTFEFAFLMSTPVHDSWGVHIMDAQRLVVFCRIGPPNEQTHYTVFVGFGGLDEDLSNEATGYLLPMTWVAREAFFESELPRLLDPPPQGGLIRSFQVVLDEDDLELRSIVGTDAREVPVDEAPALRAWRRQQDIERARIEEYDVLFPDGIPF
jgi:hypothetical protein